ncbi:MAG: efflux RND transporter periplasmic adaptor subunit [Gammaproteobacteria bacterium]
MKKLLVLVAVLSLSGLVGYRVYEAYKARKAGPAAGTPAEPGRGGGGGGFGRGGGPLPMMRVPLVDTALAREGSLEDRVQLVGSLRPIADVQIMSKIAGRVENVLVDVGDPVRAGQLLVQVEDREIQQEIKQSEAVLAVARASIQQREAELANLNRQVIRYRELHEQNLISRQDLDDWITKQQSAEAQLALSRAQARQSEASLSQDKFNLENTRSFSPMTGFVGKRFVHPGALVSANTPILNLVDLRTLRMVINVVERDIVRVNRGVNAQVAVDAFPGRHYLGKVLRVSPVLDAATRTGEVEIHVPNPQLDLRAEMFARVTLDLGGQRRGILVPREAVVYRGDKSGVFVLNGNIARFRQVQPGVTHESQVEIVEGLKTGEKIISMGASLLKDGDQVRLRGEGGPPGGGRPGSNDGSPARKRQTQS